MTAIVARGVRQATKGLVAALVNPVPESTNSDRLVNQKQFKVGLRARYMCIHPSDPSLTKCMVLGVYLKTEHVIASHLVSLRDRNVTPLLGFSSIWDLKNGILVHSSIDILYGNLEVAFVPNMVNHTIQLRVLYDGLLNHELQKPSILKTAIGIAEAGNVTYGDINLLCLILPSLVSPFRRALLRQAKSAYDMMADSSKPHSVGAQTAPTEEEWVSLFEQCGRESACGDCTYFENVLAPGTFEE